MLKDKLMEDFKESIKSGNTIRKNCIQLIRAKILQTEKDKQKELNDDEILEVIAKDIKEKKNVIPEFEKGDRQDLVDKTYLEIAILGEYMPKQLTREEVLQIVKNEKESLNLTSMKDMGTLIKATKAKIGVGSDGKTISEVVKEVLGGETK